MIMLRSSPLCYLDIQFLRGQFSFFPNFFLHLKYLTKSIHFNQFMYIYISEIYTVFISLMVVQKQTLSIYKLTVQEIVTVWHGWIGWMSRYKSILGNGGVYFFMKNKSKK